MRTMIPDVGWVRKSLTDFRIRLFDHHMLSEKETASGEESCEKRQQVVTQWEKKYPQEAEKLNKQIRIICEANSEVRTVLQADQDYLVNLKFHYCAYGFLPYEFICYGLNSKTREERKEFVPDRERNKLIYQMNDILAISLFADKGRIYDLLKDYYHRECQVIQKPEDYERFRSFTERHPVFVRKQVTGSRGSSVSLTDLSTSREDKRELFNSMIRKGKHIIEEPIRQSQEMAIFNASSVNTVRCATVLTQEGPAVAFAVFHTGREGSFVSNGGAGGIGAGVDIETGILNTDGVDEYGLRYDKHPDSGARFKGYQLPDWQEMIRICKEACVLAGKEGCHYTGWDMAHSEEHGWVIIEGNGGGQFIGTQTTSGKGIRSTMDALMKKI